MSRLTRSGAALQFCYEAGPCGYRIQRQLTAAGHGCVVVAPSLIPRKPGDRIKTDRRDATNLAKLQRAGELTPVWVPDPAHEAVRDLLRARLAAVRGLRQARQQLSGFLLRHGHHYNRPAWTLIHRRWLAHALPGPAPGGSVNKLYNATDFERAPADFYPTPPDLALGLIDGLAQPATFPRSTVSVPCFPKTR